MTLPRESKQLIEYLDKLYPDRMDIDDTTTDKERYRLEGKVELIRKLKYEISLIKEKEVDVTES